MRVKRDSELSAGTLAAQRAEAERLAKLAAVGSAVAKGGATTTAGVGVAATASPAAPVVSLESRSASSGADAQSDGSNVLLLPKLAAALKPHQITGAQFAYRSLVGNLQLLREGHAGTGALLAHSMGLGKTLTTVALVHTLLKSPAVREAADAGRTAAAAAAATTAAADERDVAAVALRELPTTAANERGGSVAGPPSADGRPLDKRQALLCKFGGFCEMRTGKPALHAALVVCPVNVVANWRAEIVKWLPDRLAGRLSAETPPAERLDVYVLGAGTAGAGGSGSAASKALQQAYKELGLWQRRGGVLVMGFERFRALCEAGQREAGAPGAKGQIWSLLVDPGPDIVVVDEAHVLRNHQ
eukprot:g3335.t1